MTLISHFKTREAFDYFKTLNVPESEWHKKVENIKIGIIANETYLWPAPSAALRLEIARYSPLVLESDEWPQWYAISNKYHVHQHRILQSYLSLHILLVLNHLLVLYNVFDGRAMTRILAFKLHNHLKYLKPFLLFLNYWRTDIGLINGKQIIDSEISLDQEIVNKLRIIDGQ